MFSTWMTRILIRECINIQRKQKRSVPMESMPEASGPEEDVQIAQLRAALAKLPQRQRTMVVLHYMEDCDVREIARIMGTTKGAVCAGLSRAREKLRAYLEEEQE